MNRQQFKTKLRKAIGDEEYHRKIAEGYVFIECGNCQYPGCEGWRFEPTLHGRTSTGETPARQPGPTVMTGTMDDSVIRRTVKVDRKNLNMVVRPGIHECPECKTKVGPMKPDTMYRHQCPDRDCSVIWHCAHPKVKIR